MARKKRDLFQELSAGIQAMRDHRQGAIQLRISRVDPPRVEERGSRRRVRGRRRRRSSRG
jgi:hypothetical protein